jgi:uncharacterized protein with ParB-like and HNH nuclease domain
MRDASKQYKRTMDFYIKREKQNNATKLRNLSEKKSQKYWKILNNLKPKSKINTTPRITEFYDHFENLNRNTIGKHF